MMADQDLVDVDPYDDGSLPVFRWQRASRTDPATRRQLWDLGLRPGGQQPAARIECHDGTPAAPNSYFPPRPTAPGACTRPGGKP
ncbi:hypothetical protein [Streptomyces sp. CAU 1734]|uniref:hypothetical protein n=1 Tax=Streptomyces sp. CAU 1734 TaxID=3140360 RepID=UPI003260E5D2